MLAAINKENISKRTVWILDDGRMGHKNQSIGLANALGFKNITFIPVKPRKFGDILGIFNPSWRFEEMPKEPFPDVVIAAGYRTSYMTRWIKRKSPKSCVVQLMTPSGSPYDYDVVVASMHDKPRQADNVMTTIGALNKITPALLKQEADRWETRLAECPPPRLAVVIGGKSSRFTFTEEDAKMLASEVITFAAEKGYSLLVTTSRRTGEAQTEILRQAFQKSEVPAYFWCVDGKGSGRDNPYLAYLALAEAVMVTAESVSMISEACTAGKPVYIWGHSRFRMGKFRVLYDILEGQHRIADFDGNTVLRAPDYPLNDTERVADFVRSKLSKF